MAVLPSIDFSGRERLKVLQQLDRVHRWTAVRDQRYCTHCHDVFDGREVGIVGGTRAAGPLRLQCPTRGCDATPGEWLRAIDGKPVADGIARDEPAVTHGGHVCTFRRGKRAVRAVAAAQGRHFQHWTGFRHAGVALLHLLPVSLQQTRAVFQHLRRRTG